MWNRTYYSFIGENRGKGVFSLSFYLSNKVSTFGELSKSRENTNIHSFCAGESGEILEARGFVTS